jgi:SAM-dependent methyltransferase|tara:strand:- start:4940 stop:5650 length:711 start_codon:yes stop_codon:yes gene_type:complete
MIKRSNREHAFKMIRQNRDWNVLDLGCGTDGMKLANHYADIENYAPQYSANAFTQTDASDTPFRDKQFDFVFSLHIAEHVLQPVKFCKELTRISKRGFIEVPTPFFDNFVVGNSNPPPHGHVWWVTFDDSRGELVFKPRLHILRELATPADTTALIPFFRDSMVLELYWEDNIEMRVDESSYSYTPGNSSPTQVYNFSRGSIFMVGETFPEKWKPGYVRNMEEHLQHMKSQIEEKE